MEPSEVRRAADEQRIDWVELRRELPVVVRPASRIDRRSLDRVFIDRAHAERMDRLGKPLQDQRLECLVTDAVDRPGEVDYALAR
jgi:hypothetical protein